MNQRQLSHKRPITINHGLHPGPAGHNDELPDSSSSHPTHPGVEKAGLHFPIDLTRFRHYW
jgi:hypothetical protein